MVVYATNIFMTTLDTYSLNDSIGYLTGRVKREMTRMLTRNLQEMGGEITAEQYRLLILLWKEGGLNQQYIADIYGKDKTSITRMLQTMERQGWITRTPDEEDKRNNKLFITREGLAVREKFFPALQKVITEAEVAVNAEDMEQCKEVLRKVITKLCQAGEDGCKG